MTVYILKDNIDKKDFIKHLRPTLKRGNSRFKLTIKDDKKGYYITYEGLKIPFRAAFSTNNKLKKISGFNFSPANKCPSTINGTCQLKNKGLCYACNGECQASSNITNKGEFKLNGYESNFLSALIIEKISANNKLFNKFIEYLKEYKFKTIRFNKAGDFKSLHDINFIIKLAKKMPGVKIYGYTARYDIIDKKIIKKINSIKNLYVNGSNFKVTNIFKVTNDIKLYHSKKLKCLGDCGACLKCFNLRGKTIYCFIHGAKSKIAADLNTLDNKKYLLKITNKTFNLKLTLDIFKNKYLIDNLKIALKKHNIDYNGELKVPPYLNFIDKNNGGGANE